jgi:hypothetical protein
MLNTEKQVRFQCYGFSVTRNSPIQIVPAQCGEEQLRRALDAKILLDVTGREDAAGGLDKIVSAIEKAVKADQMSAVKEGEEVGPPVLMGKDAKGNTYLITPRDEADYKRMQEEIRTTGTLRVEKPLGFRAADKAMPFGLSPIVTEDVAVLGAPGE